MGIDLSYMYHKIIQAEMKSDMQHQFLGIDIDREESGFDREGGSFPGFSLNHYDGAIYEVTSKNSKGCVSTGTGISLECITGLGFYYS